MGSREHACEMGQAWGCVCLRRGRRRRIDAAQSGCTARPLGDRSDSDGLVDVTERRQGAVDGPDGAEPDFHGESVRRVCVCVCGRGGGQVRRLGPFLSSLGVASGCGAGETKSPTVGGQGHMGTSELLAELAPASADRATSGHGRGDDSMARAPAHEYHCGREKRSYSCTAVVIELVRVWRVRCGARARGY